MSSRNNYLTEPERQKAPMLYECIKTTVNLIINGAKDYEKLEREAKLFLEKAGFKIEYYNICDSETLGPVQGKILVVLAAVWLGKTRLIDNATAHTYD